MRNLKRVLTMVMAIAMFMSLMVVGAGAAFSDQNKIENTDAVNMNVALNIINGRDDGSFDPAGNVTRAEMAKMICVLLNGGNEPTLGTKPTPVFTDIKGHWGEKYIEYCASLGIIAGMGDGTFAPDGNVTGTQAAKMLLVALGFDAAFEGFNGTSWSVKINVAANQKNLFEDLAIDPNAALNRDDAAQMVWNALQAHEVKYTYSLTSVNGQLQNVQVREDKDSTLLQSKYKAVSDYASVMTGYTFNETDKKFIYTMADGKQFKTADDFTALFGMNTKVVFKGTAGTSATVYGMYAEDSKVLATGVMKDLEKDGTAIKFDGAKFSLDNTYDKTKVYAENVYAETPKTLTEAFADLNAAVSVLAPYQARLIDNDNDGKVDCIVYLPFTYGQVTSVTSSKVLVKPVTGTTISIDREDDKVYTGVAKDDYVVITEKNNNAYGAYQVTEMKSFEGKVTGVRTNEILIDGTWYNVGNANVSVTKDSEYTFYAVGSYVYYTDVISAATIDNLVYVSTVKADTFGNAQAKIYDTKGVAKVVDVDAVKVLVGDTLTKYDTDADIVAKMAAGLYSFSAKNGEYTLTQICDDNLVGFKKFDEGTAQITAATSSKVGILKVDGVNYTLADDAVVYYTKADGSIKVITGAAAKNLKENAKDSKIAMDGEAQVLYNTSTNGVNTAKVVFIDSQENLPNSQGTTGNYGLVLKSAYNGTFEGDDALVFDIWNTKTGKAETVYYTGSDFAIAQLVKGAIIDFDQLDNSEIDVTSLTAGAADAVVATDDKTFVDLKTAGYAYLTDDTQFLYADMSSIKAANCSADGSIVVANEDADGNLVNNVYVVVNADKEIDLIIVDINNEWK